MRRLRTLVAASVCAALLTLGAVGAGMAHSAPPCNDTDGDGTPSGQEYAAHHIVPLAHDQGLGAGGHKPGDHHGFSLCDPAA